jgi:hypothetical protein
LSVRNSVCAGSTPPVAFSDCAEAVALDEDPARLGCPSRRREEVVEERDVVLAAVHERPEDAAAQVAREDRTDR